MISWKVMSYPSIKMLGLTVYQDGRPVGGIVWLDIDEWQDYTTWSGVRGEFHESSVMREVVRLRADGIINYAESLEITADLRDGWERCLESEPKPMTTADLIRDILRKFGA